jgi:hypothetical protein
MARRSGQQYQYDFEKITKQKKLNLLKSLLTQNKRFQESLEMTENSNAIDDQAIQIAQKLKIVNSIEKWKNNLKEYLLSNFLPGILSDHEYNVKSLNNYLRAGLNINITENVPDSFPKNCFEEIDKRFDQFNYYSLTQPQNIAYESSEENYLPIFFAEDDKIQYLIRKIDDKISNLKLHQKPINEKKFEGKLSK